MVPMVVQLEKWEWCKGLGLGLLPVWLAKSHHTDLLSAFISNALCQIQVPVEKERLGLMAAFTHDLEMVEEVKGVMQSKFALTWFTVCTPKKLSTTKSVPWIWTEERIEIIFKQNI